MLNIAVSPGQIICQALTPDMGESHAQRLRSYVLIWINSRLNKRGVLKRRPRWN